MLGINFNLNLDADVKETHYAFIFIGQNVCPHCGQNSLKFVDKFGRETTTEVYPFDHIKCTNCHRRFSIRWMKDPKTGKMVPSAVEPSIKQEFNNLINIKTNKENGTEEFNK